MKLLLLLLLAPSLTGCMGLSRVVSQLKNDPATVHLNIQTMYGSITLDRSFPTNWAAPAKP